MEANAAGMFDWHLGFSKMASRRTQKNPALFSKDRVSMLSWMSRAGLGLRGGGRGVHLPGSVQCAQEMSK